MRSPSSSTCPTHRLAADALVLGSALDASGGAYEPWLGRLTGG